MVLEKFHLDDNKSHRFNLSLTIKHSLLTNGFTLRNNNETDNNRQTEAHDEGPSLAVTGSATITGMANDWTEKKT